MPLEAVIKAPSVGGIEGIDMKVVMGNEKLQNTNDGGLATFLERGGGGVCTFIQKVRYSMRFFRFLRIWKFVIKKSSKTI